jgi:hypothetical protein
MDRTKYRHNKVKVPAQNEIADRGTHVLSLPPVSQTQTVVLLDTIAFAHAD